MHTSSRVGRVPSRFAGVWLVVLVAFVALTACSDTTTTSEVGPMPPLVLSVDGNQISLRAFASCWDGLCADGLKESPEFAVPVGEAIEMRFDAAGWTMQGQPPIDGVWLLAPLADGSTGVEVTITGRGPEGDGVWSVILVDDSAPTGLSDAEAITAFAAAIVAGDRAAASEAATPEAIEFFGAWDPFPDAVPFEEGGSTFVIIMEPEYNVECTVADGQVQRCRDVLPGEAAAGDGYVTVEQIRFAPGDFGTFVSGGVQVGERALFYLGAAEGQALILGISSPDGNAFYDVVAPAGDLLAIEETAGAILLPEPGEYQIIVGSTIGEATFDLDVAVYDGERVRFDAGTSGTTISDAVVRGERAVYVLGAGADQTMDVTISSLEDNAVFDVYPPAGPPLGFEAVTERFLLPESGDYFVVVGGTRGNATYDLSISIFGP